MDLFSWHYSHGLRYYLLNWYYSIDWIRHYFTFSLLLRYLFSPWKRLIDTDTKPGFSLDRWFRTFTFNMISRGIGAVVRITLFFVGTVFLLFTILGGAIGLAFWLILPFASYGLFIKYKKQPNHVVERLIKKAKSSKESAINIFLNSLPGKFVASHVGVQVEELINGASESSLEINTFKGSTYKDLISFLIEKNAWTEEFLNGYGVISRDLTDAAGWWDDQTAEKNSLEPTKLGKPGLGMELLFGYTPTLDKYSIDLGAPQSFGHRLIGREDTVNRIVRTLTTGISIALIGEPGVGKRTVLYEFAKRAARGELGARLSFKRVMEFDYNALLSETIDVNDKKNKLAAILSEAAYAGNIILVLKDIQRLINQSVEGLDFTDVFETHLERGSLLLVALTTPSEYDRFIAPNARLKKFIEKVEVLPATAEHAFAILLQAAGRYEQSKNMLFTLPSLRKLLQESDKFITDVPFPEKVIELLDAVIVYAENNSVTNITGELIDTVLEEKLGIPFKALNVGEKERLSNLEEIIHTRLVNQKEAVSLIAKTLRSKVVGAVESNRPIGSFLFLGPTGVGKTETAKVLANVYFRSERAMLRFDMAEFGGTEGLERLIGSVAKNRPGVLTSAIKNNPANLLLLDELEKATPEIANLFLTLLDEGNMKDAFGHEINGRSLFIIGTSNAGAEYIRQLVTEGVRGGDLREKVINYVLENGHFSPEFLNRFDGVVVYEPLENEELKLVAHLMLKDLTENLKKKNIYLTVTDEAASKLAVDGYDPAFGARPMRKIVDIELGDLIGRKLLSGEIKPGSHIRLTPQEGKNEYQIVQVDTNNH